MKADEKAPSGMNLKGLKNDFAAWILHRNRQFMRFYAGYAPFLRREGRSVTEYPSYDNRGGESVPADDRRNARRKG